MKFTYDLKFLSGLMLLLALSVSGLSLDGGIDGSKVRVHTVSLRASAASASALSSASFLASSSSAGKPAEEEKEEKKEEKEEKKEEKKEEEKEEKKEADVSSAGVAAPAPAMARLEANFAPSPAKMGELRAGPEAAALHAGAPAPAPAAMEPEELEAEVNTTNSTEAKMEAAEGSDPNVDGEVASVNIQFELRNIDYTLLDKPRTVNPLLTATSFLLAARKRKPHFETIVQDEDKMEISKVESEPTNREVLEDAVKNAVLGILTQKLSNSSSSSSISSSSSTSASSVNDTTATPSEVLGGAPAPAPAQPQAEERKTPENDAKKGPKNDEKPENNDENTEKIEEKTEISLLERAPEAAVAASQEATQDHNSLKPDSAKEQSEEDEKKKSEDSLESLKKTKAEEMDAGDKDSLDALKRTKEDEDVETALAPAPAAAALAPAPAAVASRIEGPTMAPSPAPPANTSDLTIPEEGEEKVTEVQAVNAGENESNIPIVNVHFEPGRPQGKALSISLLEAGAQSGLGSFSTVAKVHIIDRPGTGSAIMGTYEEIVRSAIEDGTLETMLESSVSTVTKDNTVVGTIYESTGSIKPYNAQRCAKHLETLIERFSAAYTRARVPEALYHSCSNMNQKESFSDDAIVDHLDKQRCQEATKRFVMKWEYGQGHVDYDRYCLELCELKHGDDAISCDAYKYIALGA